MAINPNTQYPGKVATPDANYPYGGAQNITVPGDGTGTPWEAALLNDIFGMQQALLTSSGIVPSGSPETVVASQYLQSLVELASGRGNTYTATGTVNAVILTEQTNQEPIQSYFTGLSIKFKPSGSNTGATTVNINGLGVKNIVDELGKPIVAGDLILVIHAVIIYDGISFRLQNPASIISAFGSWTPTMRGSTVAGTVWNYTTQNGVYKRIGKLLYLNFMIVVSTIGIGATGNIEIANLPFGAGAFDTFGNTAAVGSLSKLTTVIMGNNGWIIPFTDSTTSSAISLREVYGTGHTDITIAAASNGIIVQGSIIIPLK